MLLCTAIDEAVRLGLRPTLVEPYLRHCKNQPTQVRRAHPTKILSEYLLRSPLSPATRKLTAQYLTVFMANSNGSSATVKKPILLSVDNSEVGIFDLAITFDTCCVLSSAIASCACSSSLPGLPTCCTTGSSVQDNCLGCQPAAQQAAVYKTVASLSKYLDCRRLSSCWIMSRPPSPEVSLCQTC